MRSVKDISSVFKSRLGLKLALPVLLTAALLVAPLVVSLRTESTIDASNAEIVGNNEALIHLTAMESALRAEQVAIYEFMFERAPWAMEAFQQASSNLERAHDEAARHVDNPTEAEALDGCLKEHEALNSLFLGEIAPELESGASAQDMMPQEFQLHDHFNRALEMRQAAADSFSNDLQQAISVESDSRAAASNVLWFTVVTAISIGLVIAAISASRALRPIRKISDAAHDISEGDLTRRVTITGKDELADLGNSFNFMAASLMSRTAQLEQEKARMRSIHQSIGDGIIVVNSDGVVVSINPAAEVALGMAAIDLEGTPDLGVPELQKALAGGPVKPQDMVKCWEVKNCAKNDCPSHGSPDRRCWLQCGTFCYNQIQGTFRQKRDACERCDVFRRNAVHEMNLEIGGRHYSAEIVPILDDLGQEEGHTAVLHDITEIQNAKEKLEQHSRELEVLNSISETMAGSLDLETTLNAALNRVVVVEKADTAFIHLLDRETDLLTPRAFTGVKLTSLDNPNNIPRGKGCPGHVLESGKPVVETDLREVEDVPKEVLEAGLKSAVSVPLKSKNATMGTMTLLSKQLGAFNEEDARLLALIGNQIGAAADNASLYGQSVEYARKEKARNRIAAALASSLELGDAFDAFAKELGALVSFDRVSIAVPKPENQLQVLALRGPVNGVFHEGSVSSIEGTAPEWVMKHRQPYFTGDISGAMRFREQDKLVKSGMRSQLNMPLVIKDKVLGSLNFGSSRPDAYGPAEAEEIKAVAHQVALALANQELFEDVSKAKTQWETTFDSVSEGIAIVDEHHDVLRLNQAAADIVGGRVQDLIGRKCYEVIHRLCDVPATCPMSLEGQGRVVSEHESPDGRTLELVVDPMIDKKGKKRGAVHFLRDVTEAKRLRQQLLQSEKMVAVGQLVSGVAHEINNPLTGVMGYSQLLLTRDLDEKTRRDVEQINREADRATKIVQHLLSFARKHRPERKLIDVNQILRESLELKAYDLRVNNITIEQELDQNPLSLTVDPHLLQQVFLNLITNSEQAMLEANGSGLLKVTSAVSDGHVEVSFADSGPGIPEGLRDRVFDPFFTTKDVGKGTGLGLSVAYGVIQDHGGHIWVDPAYRGGARIVVQLPLSAVEVNSMPEREKQSVCLTGFKLGEILLVDDEASIREVLKETLKGAGHNVDTAKDGRVALRMLKKKHYDCVVSDVKMPGMDGPTLHRAIKDSDPDLARTFIFISGDVVSPETRHYLNEAGNPYLAKPFELDELESELQKMLGGRKN